MNAYEQVAGMDDVYRLSPNGVELAADEMRPLIERIASRFPRGTFTFYGVIGKFLRGEWTCWVRKSPDGKIETLMASAAYPDMNGDGIFQIMFVVGGDKSSILESLRNLEIVAKEAGIKKVEFLGREGWLPDMRKMGYDISHRMFIKEL